MSSLETDPLLPQPTGVVSAESTLRAYNPENNDANFMPHLKTYTAGEDASRLAAVAKELGLEQRRRQRVQVRSVVQETLTMIVFEQKKTSKNVWEIVAGVAGNVLEWYDFAVFGYFGDIIGEVFFPPQEGHAATMESFAVFGGAFLMRPVGGILLGYLGDVYGRKQALTTSIFLMAFPTFAMGCLPSYERVGYISTISLILVRLLQGMSVGGQLMSSLVFVLESVPREKWGLYGSFVWATGNFGVLLGSMVGNAVRTSFDHDALVSYGWRIPFLSGIVVSFAGFYLRSSEEGEDPEENTPLDDSSTSSPKKQEEKKNPLLLVFSKENLRPLLASAMVPMMWSAGFYLSFVWMPVYMTSLCEIPVPGAFAVNSYALFLGVCVLFPIAGWLSDRYGRRLIMSIGGGSIVLLSPHLIRTIGGQGDTWTAFWNQLILGICLSFWGSPMGAWLVESFDPEARLTSVSTGYNMAHAIAGGSTPAVATWLVDAAGPSSPAWIYVCIACVAMLGLLVVAPKPKIGESYSSII